MFAQLNHSALVQAMHHKGICVHAVLLHGLADPRDRDPNGFVNDSNHREETPSEAEP